MAVARRTPTCPYCGKPIAKAIHQDYSYLPSIMQPIGDSFIRWEYRKCNCKEAKAERKRMNKERKEFWKKTLKGKTFIQWLEERPQNKIKK